MAKIKRTLLDYLSQPNPVVRSEYSREGSNTTKKVYKDFTDLTEWKEFKYETLQTVLGNVLKNDVSKYHLPDLNQLLPNHLTPFHLTEIHDEDSLDGLLVRWNQNVVSAALTVAQRHHPKEDVIGMARGGQALFKFDPKIRYKPDWAGVQQKNVCVVTIGRQNRTVCFNVLPGDTKLSTKWKSNDFLNDKDNVNLRMPIRQVLTYCELAETRYGYLLTQEELVVLRFSHKSDSKLQDSNISLAAETEQGDLTSQVRLNDGEEIVEEKVLEMKSIPWHSKREEGQGRLTVNLALWWLHMMAAKEHSVQWKYQDLKIEYKTLGIVNSTEKRQLEVDSDTATERSSSIYPSPKKPKRSSQDMTMSFHSDFSGQI